MLSATGFMKIVAVLAIGLYFLTVCNGQETVVYSGVQHASELAGTVLDQAGAPIPQVRVSELSADSEEVRSTMTDSQGHWSFTPSEKGRTYRIEFYKYTFKKVQIRLKVTKHRERLLTVEMPVASSNRDVISNPSEWHLSIRMPCVEIWGEGLMQTSIVSQPHIRFRGV